MKLMSSGRLSLVCLLAFTGLVVLQLSDVATDWNSSLYQTLSSLSGEQDGFIIRYLAAGITPLGGTFFCIALVCLVLFWGWSVSSLAVARGFSVAMLIVTSLNSAMKMLFAASRPESGQWMESFSFPSGHASAGVAGWTMLAIIAAMGFRRRSIKVVAAGMLFCVGIAVAISRVVIGVHWPMDVIAGVFEGLLIAAIFYRLVYQREGAQPTTHDPQLLLGMTAVMSAVYVAL